MVAIGRVAEVPGGRVVRATGRRDRHSKVYTSRGPRDRRVRLSAVTAIQFYDVQDRLGYERPSEAVDWLIQKAKASIEALPKKPNVDPCSVGVTCTSFEKNLVQDIGYGVEMAKETGLKEEFLEAPNEGSQEKFQDLQHLDVDSINIPPSCSIDYVPMENSMPEFSYELGNNTSYPSPGISSEEYLMLQEEPSSWFDQVVINPSHFQKIVSSNQKFSSRNGNHMQVCSLSKLLQPRDLSSALASSMDAPIWRVESASGPMFHLSPIPGTVSAFHESTKPCVPMQFQTSKE